MGDDPRRASRPELIALLRRLVEMVLATQHELQTQRVVLQDGLTRLRMGEDPELVAARLTAQCPNWAKPPIPEGDD